MRPLHRLTLASLVIAAVSACNKDDAGKGAPVPGSSTSAAASASASAGPLTDDAAKQKALALVDAFVAGKIDDAVATFDEAMAKALPKDKAAATWKSIEGQVGAFKSRTADKIEHKDSLVRVTVRGEFEKGALDLFVVLTPGGRVTGFFAKPAGGAATPEPAWTAPAYGKPETFTEEPITVGEGDFALPGTLTLPKPPANSGGEQKPFPVVVLVHGSGPNDRDETIGATKPFKDLAWGLASRGIAVIRYEKITRVHGQKLGLAWLDKVTLASETLDDAMKAVALARKDKRLDPKRVVFLGHSQGAMAAPRAGKLDPKLAGIVMMAGPTRAFEDVALTQLEYIATLPGPNGEGTKAMLPTFREAVKLVKDKKVDAKTPKDKLPLGIPASFWLDLQGYEPAKVAAGVAMPVLVLQGEADYQVDMNDFAGWKKGLAGKANAKLLSYPGLLHSFVDCGCKLGKPDDYGKAGNVAPAVVDDLAKWVLAL